MAMYMDEEEPWKCSKHPSRRRRSGICSTCLKERLSNLCPDCAALRPCGCSSSAATSTSSSSSSSFSRFFSSGGGGGGDSSSGVGSVGRVSNLIESEPSFRRSRSLAVPFLRSRSRYANDLDASCQGKGDGANSGGRVSRTASFWGLFKRDKSKKSGGACEETVSVSCNGDASRIPEEVRETEVPIQSAAAEERSRMMRKSRSVAVTSSSYAGAESKSAKWRGWYFPSPMKAFRQPKVSKAAVAQERSPLYRG